MAKKMPTGRAPPACARGEPEVAPRPSPAAAAFLPSTQETGDQSVVNVGSNKMSKEMRPEFQQLRLMIKRDMKELLQEELKRLAENVAADGRHCHPEFCGESRQVPCAEGHQLVEPQSLSEMLLQVDPLNIGKRQKSMNWSDGGESDFDDFAGNSQPLLGGDYRMSQFSSVEHDPDEEDIDKPERVEKAMADLKKSCGFKDIKQESKKFCAEDSTTKLVRQLIEVHEGNPCMESGLRGLESLLKLREPKREGCLATIETSRMFNHCSTLVILMNAVFMVYQVNFDIEHPGAGPTSFMLMVDRIFLGLYTFELVIKLCVHRLYFFWNADMQWNFLDFTLVVYSYVEMAINALARDKSTGNATWMRSLRLCRIAKVLRILRVVKSFKELRLILHCIMGSMQSMVWSVAMLLIMFYMFSLTLVQQTGLYLSDYSGERANHPLLENFGTVQTCMWTLFKSTFGGTDWSLFYEEVEKLGVLAIFVWFLFIVFTHIVLLNILTGIFVENALQLAEGDAQAQAIKHEEKMLEDATELRKLCSEWDVDDSNTFSKSEFERMAQSDEFSRYLRFIGLEKGNIEMFFNLIREKDLDEHGEVDISTFVAGCMMLRGTAKSSDLMAVMFEMKKLKRAVDQNRRSLLEFNDGMRKLSMELKGSLDGSKETPMRRRSIASSRCISQYASFARRASDTSIESPPVL